MRRSRSRSVKKQKSTALRSNSKKRQQKSRSTSKTAKHRLKSPTNSSDKIETTTLNSCSLGAELQKKFKSSNQISPLKKGPQSIVTKASTTPTNQTNPSRLVNNSEMYNNNNNNNNNNPSHQPQPTSLNNTTSSSINSSNLIEINTSNNDKKTQKLCITKTLPPLPLPDVDPNDFMDQTSSTSIA
jgi:hypothetical protein